MTYYQGLQELQAITSFLMVSWNFNEGQGTTLNDLSGSGNDGTINGATWTGDALKLDAWILMQIIMTHWQMLIADFVMDILRMGTTRLFWF